ncbi:MarR family winged helix-turn-helix transcriptional regulator [Roseicella frigidaeris]|uniref:MarR family transcriptional regulator n=1 Tax=Roseicella frigidaeris TaxID=2230885 RepID=A0A327M6L2_9PROT|nr:MarR family transcriptional regulator [Roseicella frigidaeris]RAI57944.1 MarR family transcriptional regulator [Roseicella frigidaeris]
MSDATRTNGEFRIGFLVHDVSRLRQILFDQEMRPHGVTRAQWSVLAQLSRKENGGMTQAELARLLGLGKVAVGSMLDRLESAGLVVRRHDAHDRRINRVFVTAQGRRILGRMVEVGRRLHGQVLAGLSAEEVATANHVLARMRRNIRQALQEGSAFADRPEDAGSELGIG